MERFEDPIETARELTAELRSQGAEVVVGLTHLLVKDDRRLLETLGDEGPDVILGGHDHEKMAVDVGKRRILKADADARTATVVRISLAPAGRPVISQDFRKLEGLLVKPDPDVLELVGDWQAKHEREFCTKAGSPPGCLGEVYGLTRTLLEAEENKIRGFETSLGDWVADQMVETLKECGAQAAFINSGSLRLNQDLPAGTRITRRHVEELFGYPTPLHLIRIDGATLQKVADRAVENWPGSGSWLQVSGFAYVHDPDAAAARNLTLLSGGARPVRPDETILVATNDYPGPEDGGSGRLHDAEPGPEGGGLRRGRPRSQGGGRGGPQGRGHLDLPGRGDRAQGRRSHLPAGRQPSLPGRGGVRTGGRPSVQSSLSAPGGSAGRRRRGSGRGTPARRPGRPGTRSSPRAASGPSACPGCS